MTNDEKLIFEHLVSYLEGLIFGNPANDASVRASAATRIREAREALKSEEKNMVCEADND